MEQRVSMIALGVEDLDRAKAFYEEVIGWKAAPGPEGILFFDIGGLVFSLYPHEDLAKDMKVVAAPLRKAPYRGFALAHNVRSPEDADAIFARLEEQGATIIKMPEQVFWGGYSGYFADPDGHVWEIAHNPHWPIDDQGRISLGGA